MVGNKYTTNTGYKVEVKEEKKDILICYSLDENFNRIKERKMIGKGFKTCIISKSRILNQQLTIFDQGA